MVYNERMGVLVIGSVTCDISLYMDHLPSVEEDVNITGQKMSLGGCAFNVSNMLRLMNVPYQLTARTGTGIFGDFVRHELLKQNRKPMFVSSEENGVCYTFVDAEGNRTFAAVHGAEYLFTKSMLDQIDMEGTDRIYFCGLEIEEKTGDEIISFLEEHRGIQMFFAPGPRITGIPGKRMERILNLHPSVHLNAREASSFLKNPVITSEEAVRELHEKGFSSVIMTDGEKPVTVYESGKVYLVPARMSHVKDGTGAGDSHIGTILGCMEKGLPLKEAVQKANLVSATVTECEGPVLTDQKYQEIREELL